MDSVKRPLRISAFLAALVTLPVLPSSLACAAGFASDAFQVRSAAPPESPLVEARSLLDKGAINDAEKITREFLKTRAGSADAHFLLGLIIFRETQKGLAAGDIYNDPSDSERKFRKQKAAESLAEFTEGAKYRDPSAFDLKIVALNYVLLGAYADADRWLTRSVTWNPQDPEAWYYLGRIKYNENRFDEAIQAFQKCLKLEPRNAKAQDNLGLSYVGLNRVTEAIAAFQTAIDWQDGARKKDAGPYIDLGSLLMDQNRVEEALPVLLQAADAAPQQSKSHELLGKAYSLLGKLPEAQAELETAVRLSPQTAHLHFMLGQVYRRQGLTEKAKQEFDRMAQLTKNSQPAPAPNP